MIGGLGGSLVALSLSMAFVPRVRHAWLDHRLEE